MITAIVAIFITASEALAEVVVIGVPVYLITTVAVVCVSIGIGVSVVATPTVVPVRLSGAEAFLIAIGNEAFGGPIWWLPA